MSFHPYLSFNGNCREAMLFYQSCFGGELAVHFLNESHVDDTFSKRVHSLVVEAVLSTDVIRIFGTDLGLEEKLTNGNRVSLLVQARNSEHLCTLYDALSYPSAHLKKSVAKGEISNVTDRYGVQWLIYY